MSSSPQHGQGPTSAGGRHRTSLNNTSTSCTETTQCDPISWLAQVRPGVAGHRESCGHAGEGAHVRLHGDAHWSSAGSKENLERSIMHESTGGTKGTHTAYGGDRRAWDRPAWGLSAQWQHQDPRSTHAHCQCQTPTLFGGCFFSIPQQLQQQSPSPADTGAEALREILLGRSVHSASHGFIQVSKGNG